MHGKDAVIEEILDWQPGRSWTSRSIMPMPGSPALVMTDELQGLPAGGTRVISRIARPRPRERETFLAAFPMIEPLITEAGRGIIAALAEELDRRAASEDGVEPEPPASTGRFLTEPVAAGAAGAAAGAVDSARSGSSSA